MQIVTSRKCKRCDVEKPTSDLVPSKAYTGGFMPLCKVCRNKYWRDKRAASEESRRADVDRVRKSRILRKLGVTIADYEGMVADAGDKCQLCGTPDTGRKAKYKFWNIDHCHATNRVRGILCHTCNIGLGYYEQMLAKVGRERLDIYLQ